MLKLSQYEFVLEDTYDGLLDCYELLRENGLENLSDIEVKNTEQLVKLCFDIVNLNLIKGVI